MGRWRDLRWRHRDAGAIDGGPIDDGGSDDSGSAADSGSTADSGVAADGGTIDSGVAADAGVVDSGGIVDSGGTFDSGGIVDSGGTFDSGAADSGSAPCAPQQIDACACAGGVPGTQQCRPTGGTYAACDCTQYGREIFVAVTGSDAASGDVGAPKATLSGALTVVRALVAGAGIPAGGVVIWMAGGVYQVPQTIDLGPDVRGAPGRPVVIRAQAGAPVRLVGGVELSPAGFTSVTARDPNYARLDPIARANVRVFDLSAAGVTDLGQLQVRGFCRSGVRSGLELFVDGEPMRLGRWPDADQNDVVAPTAADASIDLYGAVTPDVTGRYVRVGSAGGAPIFERVGLVDGLQYRLYRSSWVFAGTPFQAWFLTTSASGYPSDPNPWWSLYATGFDRPMEPSAGAAGEVTFIGSTAVNHGFVTTASALSDTQVTYSQDRPGRWTSAPDAWLHGFWRYGWADCHVPLASVDPAARSLTLGSAPNFGTGAGAPFYAYNLLEEVTQPGEWYIDRARGRLYLYPPHDLSAAEITVSMLAAPILRLDSAELVELRGLVLEASRSTLLEITGGRHNRVAGVTLRNAGADGATVSGTDNGVSDALVTNVGGAAVRLSGGDRPSLVPGGNFVTGSSLHRYARWDWTYRPGVELSGVGQRAANNHIHDAPHSAVLFYGNEHVIELNDIHDTNRFATDAGAIYGGRDWGGRGVVIRNNHLHRIQTYFPGTPIAAVYLDDCLSGIRVEGNIVTDVRGLGVLHGGGRDNIMVGNVFARTDTGLSSDARCSTWARPTDISGDSHNLLELIVRMRYQQPPWSVRYPLLAAIPNNYPEIFAPPARWLFPEGSSFSSNLGFEVSVWMTQQDGAFAHFPRMNNVELAASPFVDEAAGDLSLTPAALAVPGVAAIPVDRIGVQ